MHDLLGRLGQPAPGRIDAGPAIALAGAGRRRRDPPGTGTSTRAAATAASTRRPRRRPARSTASALDWLPAPTLAAAHSSIAAVPSPCSSAMAARALSPLLRSSTRAASLPASWSSRGPAELACGLGALRHVELVDGFDDRLATPCFEVRDRQRLAVEVLEQAGEVVAAAEQAHPLQGPFLCLESGQVVEDPGSLGERELLFASAGAVVRRVARSPAHGYRCTVGRDLVELHRLSALSSEPPSPRGWMGGPERDDVIDRGALIDLGAVIGVLVDDDAPGHGLVDGLGANAWVEIAGFECRDGVGLGKAGDVGHGRPAWGPGLTVSTTSEPAATSDPAAGAVLTASPAATLLLVRCWSSTTRPRASSAAWASAAGCSSPRGW